MAIDFNAGSKELRKSTILPVLEYLQKVSLQHKCKFEFLITRNPLDDIDKSQDVLSNVVDVALSVAGTAADVLITKFFLQSINFPSEASLEYERLNGNKYVKSIVYPETVKLQFLETEDGIVRRYLTEWFRKIFVPVPKDGPINSKGLGLGAVIGAAAGGVVGGLGGNAGSGAAGFVGGAALGGALGSTLGMGVPEAKAGSYVFKDNQEAAKRTGMLLMYPKDGSFPLYPRIMFYGLSIMSIGDYTVDQKDEAPLMYDVEFSVDEIKIPQIF